MTRLKLTSVLIGVCLFLSAIAGAGIRAAGKYSGVVIFDRWGGCILFSGIYLMYVSEHVKEQLRQYDGQAVEIDAKDVFQPINPGDGLIRSLEVLGLAKVKQDWYTLEGIKLDAEPVSVDNPHVTISLTIMNENSTDARIASSEIGFALLSQKGPESSPLSPPSDGPSAAVITRTDALSGEGHWTEEVDGRLRWSYSFVIADEDRLPRSFDLPPNQSKTTRITFMLPSGQYQFFAGYGGGVHEEKLVVSNPVSVDF